MKEEKTEYELRKEDRLAGFVECDGFCKAKENPETLKEYKATLEHYKSHSLFDGCSHGC